MSIFSTSYSDSDIAQIQQLLENKVACAFYNFGHSIQSFFEKQTTGNDGKDL